MTQRLEVAEIAVFAIATLVETERGATHSIFWQDLSGNSFPTPERHSLSVDAPASTSSERLDHLGVEIIRNKSYES